ncbi:MAG: MFS transporter [Dehalococcoidia bacterium]
MRADEGALLPPVPPPQPLLRDRRFQVLWLSQGLSQLAQYSILFTLLVLVVKLTGSSTYTSLLILSFVVPSVVFGMVAGVLVDRWGKARAMAAASAFRAATCLLLFLFHDSVWVIYGINLGFATANQFFNPAAVALIPALAKKERLIAANSAYSFTLTGSQFVGMVILAPTLIKTTGEGGMFVVGAALFAVSAALAYPLRAVDVRPAAGLMAAGLRRMGEEFRHGWRVLRSDRAAILAMVHLTLGSSLVLLFAILIPLYMNDILKVSPDNAAFVFAPTGVGALVGLRTLPWLSQRLSKTQIVVWGLVGLAASLVALSLVEQLAEALRDSRFLDPERLGGLSLLVTLTMAFSGPMGFFYSLLNAPAQTVLHERAPAEVRGRLFASQIVTANAVSLVPLLLLGGITDLLGISWVLVLIALVALAVAVASIFWWRRGEMEVAPRALAGGDDFSSELATHRRPGAGHNGRG